MKTLIIFIVFLFTTIICYGQSVVEKERSVYSMSKETPVIKEVNSLIKMDSTEKSCRTNISMYKNVTDTGMNVNTSILDSTAIEQKKLLPANSNKKTGTPK